jgi:hypothetical protein
MKVGISHFTTYRFHEQSGKRLESSENQGLRFVDLLLGKFPEEF